MRADARFCASCGARLERSCPACGERSELGAAFCASCGAPLAARASTADAVEERKVVTVLYADLVGSTAAADRVDPEDVRARLTTYHGRLRHELELVGGTVEKFIGDAVVALFGAPATREDDPERALRAAFAILDAIAELNAADPSLGLEVRIGVHTGEALVSLDASTDSGENIAAGDVMNTGARLEGAAAAGGILVGEPTYRATRHVVEYGDSTLVRAKGKAEAIAAWPALRLRGAAREEVLETPLVGRADELDLLAQTLDRVRREHAPQLLTIIGAPGIGKSRLLLELFAAANGEAPLRLQGNSLPYGEGASFHALAEMARSYVGVFEAPSPEDAAHRLQRSVDAAVPDPEEARWVGAHLRPLLGLASEEALHGDRRAETFAAWRRWFEALAESRPLALVFEDVHWADDGLLDFVDQLVDWTADVPLLVLATARPELLERRPAWGGGKRNTVTMSLSPLDQAETGKLLAELLDGASLPSEVEALMLMRSGGNPLYAAEYVRMLVDRGLLGRGDEADLARSRELPLPESVHGIVAARLDALPIEEKVLVQDAAVVGDVFWVGALAAAASLPRVLVEERLRVLERKEFLRRERVSSVANESQYAFRHVVVREVAYGQLPRARRAERHRLAAEWLEALTPGASDDRAELIAHHYLSALDLSRAAGRDVSGLIEPAGAAAVRAGRYAASVNAHAAAARFYATALELSEVDSDESARLLLRVGEALFHAEQGGFEQLEQASEALVRTGDVERAAVADVLLATLLVNQGSHGAAEEHLERAATLLSDAPPSRGKVFVLSSRARFLGRAGRPEEAIVVGREALAMAERLGLDDLRAQALDNVGVARLAKGDQGAVDDFERSLAIAEAIRSPESTRAYRFLASTLAMHGELARSFELFGEGRRAAERFGDAFEQRWLRAALVAESYWRGRWSDAVSQADEFVAAAAAGSPHYMETACRRVRGLIRLARGDLAGAVDDAERGLDVARKANDPWHLNQALAMRARTLVAAGDVGGAAESADELLEAWSAGEGPVPSFESFDLAVALLALERGDELDRVRGTTRWLQAAKAYARRDFAGAAAYAAEIGSRPEEACALLEADDPDDIERALAFFRQVGASAYVAAAERGSP